MQCESAMNPSRQPAEKGRVDEQGAKDPLDPASNLSKLSTPPIPPLPMLAAWLDSVCLTSAA